MAERASDLWESFMDEGAEMGSLDDDSWRQLEELRAAEDRQLTEQAKKEVKEFYGEDF